MNLALMFFKVRGGGGDLAEYPSFLTLLLSVCLGYIYKPTYFFFFPIICEFHVSHIHFI